jgi:hypothetical protein
MIATITANQEILRGWVMVILLNPLQLTALGRRMPEYFGAPLPLSFSQVLILKLVKVLCFDTLLQVLILKVVSEGPMRCCLEASLSSNYGTDEPVLLEQTSEGEVPTARGDDD